MITYEKFKELFDSLDSNRDPEIEIWFDNKEYMLSKDKNYVYFSTLGKEKNKIMKYNSLEELYNNKTIDNICLKNDWNKIKDIIIDMSFSVVNDKEDIYKIYKIKL